MKTLITVTEHDPSKRINSVATEHTGRSSKLETQDNLSSHICLFVQL